MPKILFNGLVKGLSGRVGDLIFRQMPDGSTVVSQASRGPKIEFSQKQLDNQERFQQAALYARQAAKDHPIYAELAARKPAKSAYNIAFSDWWTAPVIHHIQRLENRIVVRATDNVLVTRVQVTVLDHDGQVMERGEAVRSGGDWWEFTSNTEGKTVIAEAWDLPENVTKFVLE